MKKITSLLLLISLFFGFGGCGGKDQIYEKFDLQFSTIEVCSVETKLVSFVNSSSEELVVLEAAIAPGTNPDGSFKLESARVAGVETKAFQNIVNDVRVPAGETYTFVVSFEPQTYLPGVDDENTSSALLNIIYGAPEEGVIQIALGGISSAGQTATCPDEGETDGGITGGVHLVGEKKIVIDKIALLTSAVSSSPITTDPEQTVRDFISPGLPVNFTEDGTITLPLFSSATLEPDFLLPPSSTGVLAPILKGDTEVTTTSDAFGVYDEVLGSISVTDVPIHLKEKFEADFVVTLTTENVVFPTVFKADKLPGLGFKVGDDQKSVQGSRLEADTLKVTLVGVSVFTNASGTGTIAGKLKDGNVKGIVSIEAHIE